MLKYVVAVEVDQEEIPDQVAVEMDQVEVKYVVEEDNPGGNLWYQGANLPANVWGNPNPNLQETWRLDTKGFPLGCFILPRFSALILVLKYVVAVEVD